MSDDATPTNDQPAPDTQAAASAAEEDDARPDDGAERAAAEKLAAMLLKRAKFYLKNNMTAKAKPILQRVVDDYGSTASVPEAQELLKDL